MLQGLTRDRALLDAALDRISVAQTMRLDLAVEAGRGELEGDRGDAGNAKVLVLLTDGRANPVGPEVAVRKAQAAKDARITIFTIGLGDDLDVDALAAMASTPDRFYRAPDGGQLAEIYRRIAVALPCAAGQFWARRP